MFTFASSHPGVQSLVLTLLCVLYTVVHCLASPLRRKQAQALQTVLLVCLVVVALSGTPFAEALEKAALSNPSGSSITTESDRMAVVMQTAFGVLVPLVAVVVAHAGPWILKRLRARYPSWAPSWVERLLADWE